MGLIQRFDPHEKDLGAFTVRRMLPRAVQRKVGPWVFIDHFGPAVVEPGEGMQVRPHPHIGLSTVSYLFEGAIHHRDSLGSDVVIRPNEVHWMRAGHGIVHSERSPTQDVATPLHGLQLWCAHPDGEEEQAPAFGSWSTLPELDRSGVRIQLLAGTGWGEASPVDVTSPLVYAIAHLEAGQQVALPDHEERCAYWVSGSGAIDGESASANQLLVVDSDARQLTASSKSVVAILGGAPIGPRFMWWNLVHSDRAVLVEQAQRWRDGGFPTVPGDTEEHIPAPEGP